MPPIHISKESSFSVLRIEKNLKEVIVKKVVYGVLFIWRFVLIYVICSIENFDGEGIHKSGRR